MKTPFIKLLIIFCVILINSCSSAQSKVSNTKFEIQENVSFKIDNIQFQRWIAGVQGGGSGYHIYIAIHENKNHVTFDSIYYKGYAAKIKVGKMGCFANIKTPLNQKNTQTMSGEKGEEYGNTPKITSKTIYSFGKNSCVIRYTEQGKVLYYKYNQMLKKEQQDYPSKPINKD